MERRLRKLFEPKLNSARPPLPVHSILSPAEQPRVQAAFDFLDDVTVPGRRNTLPSDSPAASYADGGNLSVHAIRDLNGTGLYLVTRDRWPIGAEINMNLQPGGGVTGNATAAITVRMRVTRWGADGVGLEFAGAATEASDSKSLHVC
jgi:hypothetical protein